MFLTIEINLNNRAFKGDNGIVEVERILADLGTRLPDPLDDTVGHLLLHDVNGYFCGTASINRPHY